MHWPQALAHRLGRGLAGTDTALYAARHLRWSSTTGRSLRAPGRHGQAPRRVDRQSDRSEGLAGRFPEYALDAQTPLGLPSARAPFVTVGRHSTAGVLYPDPAGLAAVVATTSNEVGFTRQRSTASGRCSALMGPPGPRYRPGGRLLLDVVGPAAVVGPQTWPRHSCAQRCGLPGLDLWMHRQNLDKRHGLLRTQHRLIGVDATDFTDEDHDIAFEIARRLVEQRSQNDRVEV